LLLLLFIFLPAAGAIIASGLDHRGHAIQEAGRNTLLLAESLAAQQEQIAIGTKQMLSTIAQLPMVQNLDVSSCNELFRNLNSRRPFYSTISAAAPDGKLFAASAPFAPGSTDLSDRKYIRDAIRTLDFSAGEFVVGKLSNVQTLSYAHPVFDGNRDLVAIVIATFKLDEYARFFGSVDLPEEYVMSILDYRGVHLYHLPNNDAAAPGVQIAQETFELMSGDRDHGIFERLGGDGINRIYAFKRLRLSENSPPYLFVSVGCPKEKILQKANMQMLSNLSILGLAALSAMLLAWLFGNLTFVAPIKRLVAAAQLFGRGELGTRTGLPHTPDELGQLAESFDEMASLLEMRSIERKRAEQALRESEVKHRTLFESATDAIFLVRDNKFIDCNDAALRMYGYTREELIGNYPYAISPPVQPNGTDSKEEAVKKMAGAFSGAPQFFEWRHCRSDGTPFDAEVGLNRMELGNEILIQGIVRDITSRKQAEKALQESAWFQQQLIDALPAPVFFKDPEGRYLGCNKAYESFLNRGKDEIIGKSVFETAPEELADIYREKDLALLWSPGIQIYESSVRDADGSVHSVVFHKATFSRPDGSVGGLIGAMLDITERKRAEKELKDSEQQLRSIIQGYPLPAFVIGKDHQVVYWNKALEEMSKIKANEVVGTKEHWRAFYREQRPCIADLLVDDNREGAVGWYGEGIGESEVLDGAYEATEFFPNLGETGKWLHFTAAAVRNSRGAIVGAIETLEDITDREKAEAVLRESENRYRAIFENTGAATLILEEDTTISLANAEFEKLTGYTRDEIENKKSWTEFVVKEDLERMLDQHRLRRADAKAALQQYEFRLIDKHDQTRDCLLTVDMIADTKRSVASFLDITERRQAEDALISANRRLNDIIEFLPDATLVIDRDKKIIAWNRAIEKMTGVSKKEMMGKDDIDCAVSFYGERRLHLLDLIDACDEDLESRYQHVTKKGGILRAETYVPCVYGGKGAYVFCTGAPLFDAHGNRVGAIESIRDVSEQRQAQEALRRSEEKYRELVENANSIILRMDNAGNVTFFNEFAQRFFGYSEEEILGKNVVGAIVPEVESTTRRDLRLMIEAIALNPDRYASNINENMRRSGERVWVAWTNQPILDENGRVVEVFCVGNDVTERKKAEEELRRSEERFKILFECAPDPYYLCDMQGNFVDGNRAAEEAAGYKREELIGKNIFESNLMLPEEIPKARELLAGNRLGYPSGPDEFVLNQKGGKQVFLETRTFPTVIREQHLVLGIARDITKRKQAEEELRESRQQLSDMIDFLPDATFVIDKEGKVIAWNRAIEDMTGISAADMLGKGNYEYALPFYGERRPILIDLVLGPRPEIERRYAALERTDGAIAGEAYMPALGGGEVYHSGKASALFDSKGNVVGAIESIRDNTERKQAEEALRRANILLFTQKETSIDGILAVNEHDTVILSNHRFADMWGISREAVEAQVHAPLLQSASDKVRAPQAFLQRIGYLYAHRNETSLEEIALKDGRTFERYSAPMNGTDGRYYGRVWYFRDITERKHMEEAVAEAEAQYRGIFENSVMGIFQSTPEGRLLSLNMALARILGYHSPEQLINEVSDLPRQVYVNPERRFELLRLIEERGMAQEFEAQVFRKDRSVAWISVNIHAVHDVNGKIIRMEGTAQEITESKRLSSQLYQAQKMEAIGTLAGGIAHDFNNILMPIIGYAELSLSAVPKGARLHHNIEQILLSGNRARELVKQILTFSRKTEKERRPVQVSLLVKETLKLLRSSLPSTIKIRRRLDADAIDSTVLADPTHIHQVLMNLCTNAAHAMREKAGVLSITLKNVDIGSVGISELPDLAPGSYVKLSVADTGHGMDEAVRQRIFDPYFSTKGPSEGTGLGLALVYGIITSLSGGVTVSSEPGQGATFDIYFPRARTLQAPKAEVPEPLPTGKGLVLVVDDEQPIVDMLKEMLGVLGYDVAGRYSSYDALQAFKARPDSFDLVITDLTMPNMTGIDLAREILKIRPNSPIILCTGFSEAIDENRSKLLGIRGFLMKPIALRDLAATVKKILFQDKAIT